MSKPENDTPAKRVKDLEIVAMSRINDVLEPLTEAQRQRVVKWVTERWSAEPTKEAT